MVRRAVSEWCPLPDEPSGSGHLTESNSWIALQGETTRWRTRSGRTDLPYSRTFGSDKLVVDGWDMIPPTTTASLTLKRPRFSAALTGRYLHASLTEVAAAVAALTGEAHPLVDGRRPSGGDGSRVCSRR